MTGRAKSIAVVSVGFALYRFAATYLYGSGLGMHQESVGFVSDLGFVLAMNAASCLVALACLILLRRRRPCRLVASPFVASSCCWWALFWEACCLAPGCSPAARRA